MSLYTHWACFTCRKSFHRVSANEAEDDQASSVRHCPECGKAMYDFGVYFQPPRRHARRQWAIMQLLAEHGYRFQTEGNVAYINHFLLAGNRTSLNAVRERIQHDKRLRAKNTTKARVQILKGKRSGQ